MDENLTKEDVIKDIPLDTIIKIKRIMDRVDTKDKGLVDKYNQLRTYDDKLRRGESVAGLEAFNIVDDILTRRYISNTETAEWKYETSLRIVMSLMLYGCINIELDEVTKEEFIQIRTDLKTWYKKFKKVVV
jgi:hypothetical protein